MAEGNTFKLKIYSPSRVFYNGEADMVELVTTEGEIGIYKGHIPLTAVVAPGVLKIHNGGEVREASLVDGFLTIDSDTIVILSEACEWPEEIDVHRAEEARIRAERRLKGGSSNVDMNRAEVALKRSLVRLNLAKK